MSDFFDRFEQDLRRAGRHRSRTRRRPLAIAVATLAALLLGAGAAAATYYVLRVSPIAPFRSSDSIPDQIVRPGTSAVLDLRAKDPDGVAPPWTLRLARSQTGLLCGTVGQVQGRRFGLVGLDGRFRQLPEANADACSEPDADGLTLLGARIFAGRRDADTRTVVYGAAGTDVTRATLEVRGRPAVAVPAGRDGSFVVALAGYPEDIQPTVRLRWRSGRHRTIAFATSPFVVPDPGSGRAFKLQASAFGSSGGVGPPDVITGCVQFRTARVDRSDRGASSPPACGREPVGRPAADDTLYFTTRRLSGDRRSRGYYLTGDWNDHPARVAVWGNARSARRLEIRAPGGVSRSATPTVNGSFLAFLPDRTDPSTVTVTALLRDGSTRRFGPTFGIVPNPYEP